MGDATPVPTVAARPPGWPPGHILPPPPPGTACTGRPPAPCPARPSGSAACNSDATVTAHEQPRRISSPNTTEMVKLLKPGRLFQLSCLKLTWRCQCNLSCQHPSKFYAFSVSCWWKARASIRSEWWKGRTTSTFFSCSEENGKFRLLYQTHGFSWSLCHFKITPDGHQDPVACWVRNWVSGTPPPVH